MLNQFEVPVAFSMVAVAKQIPANNPIQKYITLWVAFNNIYTTLTEYSGEGPTLRTDENGVVRTKLIAGRLVPQVKTKSESEQILIAVDELSLETKQAIIGHPSTAFFVYRVPEWRGQKIEFDSNGQRVNGVINVGRTVNARYPVWSPIEIDRYERFARGRSESDDVNLLVEQLVRVLYTIRNNAMHGGKRADHENDLKVATKALPLLEMIVSYFLTGTY